MIKAISMDACASHDIKHDVIDFLLGLYKKELASKQPYKARAYKIVIDNIKSMKEDVYCLDDLKNVKGIGKSIHEHLHTFITQGSSSMEPRYHESSIEDLMRVHGIGIAKAMDLYKTHGVKDVNGLRQLVIQSPEILNEKQKIALQYVDDFSQRIPRKEMEKHSTLVLETIRAIDKEFIVELTGSYRREQSSSGDIDVLITHPDPERGIGEITDALLKSGYIIDAFAKGPKKCLAVCRLKRHKVARRIDLMLTTITEYPFALLYFTGCGEFNIKMRNVALSQGYSMSEHGLKHVSTNTYVDHTFKTEHDIFSFLGVDYVQPKDRTPEYVFSKDG